MTTDTSLTSIKRYFHRHFFDKLDPAQRMGTHFPAFSVFHLYSDIDQQKTHAVCKSVYERIINKVCKDIPSHIKVELVSFADKKLESLEGSRDYIVITRTTARGTRSTIIVRCFPYGRNIYLALDSYALGTLNYQHLIVRIYASIIPFILLLCPILCILGNLFQSIVSTGRLAPDHITSSFLQLSFCIIPIGILIVFMWLDLIRGFFYHRNLRIALRESFNSFAEDESFNADDVFMFLKSILPIVIESIQQVFKENNIDIRMLEDFARVVNNINNINETFINYAANQGLQGNNQGSSTVRNILG